MTEENASNDIVVGIDGSAHSIQALVWAAQDASLHGCGLRLVHVLPKYEYDVPFYPPGRWEEVRDRGRDLLAEASALVKDTHPDVPVTTDAPSGSPAQVFHEMSETSRAIVLGARGTDVGNVLMGSTATQLVGHAACPVVIVGHPSAGHSRVVVGNDGSHNAEDALLYAFEEASLRGAEVHVIRSWRIPLPSEQSFIASELKTEHQRRARELARDLEPFRSKFPDLTVIEDVPCDKPVHALARASHRADLVVVGSRGLGGFHGLAVGSVSHKLLQMAACPVAVVRPS